MLSPVSAGCRAFLLCLALLGSAGCDLTGDPSGPGRPARRTEVMIEPQAGLEGAVQIDSVSWRPLPVEVGPGVDEGLLEGTFAARFTSLTQAEVQIRYDLRFLDADEFLVDSFIPFGQPVRLSSGQVLRVSGEFTLRSDDPLELVRVVVMRLHARVMPSE